jgi:nicotinate-nucleotide--dimethylbenzimidazole phosphoribosyltransferase
MSPASRSLIAPTSNRQLEEALREKLQRRRRTAGSMGELEPLALRLGLMQNTLKPRLRDPRLLVFASDHGLAVDGLPVARHLGTRDQVLRLLDGQLPVGVFARIQGLDVTVVDAGVAEPLPKHEKLLVRKIAHGTRNARVNAAMSVEQAHAAIRAGMEIAETLRGNMLACAGIGVGGHESAALILSRLADCSVRDLLLSHEDMDADDLAHMLVMAQGAQGRHRGVIDPIEVLAAFGGFEIAMMVGAMLAAASKRHLVIVDGMAACAALMVAVRIAAPVTDYCVFCRSHDHQGLDRALQLFGASALLEMGMQSIDGTGVTLSWPLVKAAVALLSDVLEDDRLDQPPPEEEAGTPEAGTSLSGETH